MAAGRRRQRRRRGQESKQGTEGHTQLERNQMQCSNHSETHKLVLFPDGKVSEHWIRDPAVRSTTRLVKELETQDIVQIACGNYHSMALSRGGVIFTWGKNTHGQLGLGSQTPFSSQPRVVKTLQGVPHAQIAAGGSHSITVSLSGAVYSWGKNEFGQLGLGDTNDRDCPTYVGALEHWKTVFISCGADHTAVLSKEGLVCTFGAGGAGQLGHNSTRNELTPRVVAELWGARVSQVACGRQYTLAYVPSLEKVYFFGSDEGHLGDKGKTNQLIPLPVNAPVSTGKCCQGGKKSEKVIELTAEGNPTIVLRKKRKILNRIATLQDEMNVWLSDPSLQHWKTIKTNIRLIFSSEACINGSFLEKRDKHFKTSKEVSGVDMSQVQDFYKEISKMPEVLQQVLKEIEKLLPSLSSSPTSPENFRVYLILPFLLQGEDDSSYCSLRLLAQAIMKLQPKAQQTLECLWSSLETSFFKQLVILYQRVSQKILSQFLREIIQRQRNPFDLHAPETAILQTLQILYQVIQTLDCDWVNSRTGFRVQENNFHVPQVKVFVRYYCLFSAQNVSQWKLTKYPFIFDMKDKTNIHNIECTALSIHCVMVGISCTVEQKCWLLPVRRHYLLQDIWTCLNNASTQEFKKMLKVAFVGEEGMDHGGLVKELFSVAARTLCHPDTGAFRRVGSGLAWFPSQASSSKENFFQIGTLCGMALYNMCMAPFPFPTALYKKLLGLAPTLEDLEELSPGAGRNLQRILDEECDEIFENLSMNFMIIEEGDSMVTVELKAHGANIPVTRDNRKEFVDLYMNYVFNESIRKPFEDFMQGFLRGCPGRKWKMFLPAELQTVLQGCTKFDWHLLEKNVNYICYGKLDQTIRNFWTVFHKLPEEKKKLFLAFLSGSDRIPGYGQENFTFHIKDPQVANPDEVCIKAHTCSRVLFLPRYSTKRILKKELLYAIEHSESFGLA
ncbi:probable E3 ubiquitin-protein ligase HERC4 isoform X1 [Melanerpes formicivorus]|uniref:probable E3 ubiquitin-protein ligase HERC4 isoform X1 n=2 Tax=Melanerpes formicivorus TaxID=211600 RepID=UPI00358F21C9